VKFRHDIRIFDLTSARDADRSSATGWALACLIEEARNSPSAAALLNAVFKDGWTLSLSRLPRAGYALNFDDKTILIDDGGLSSSALARSASTRHDMMLTLLRALCHAGQVMRGYGEIHAALQPDSALMLDRAASADSTAFTALVAWELRGALEAGPWRTLLGSSDGDIALAFAAALESAPKSLYDGAAAGAAFLQWYAGDARIAASDHAALDRLDYRLSSPAQNQTAAMQRRALRARDVECLFRLPFGRAYLKTHAAMVAGDPYFLRLDDPVNAAHLIQVVEDSNSVIAGGVPFRSAALARKIFPAFSA